MEVQMELKWSWRGTGNKIENGTGNKIENGTGNKTENETKNELKMVLETRVGQRAGNIRNGIEHIDDEES